jgi:large subunit ribosomal protein L24
MPPASRPIRATRVPDIRKGDQVLVLTGKDAGKRGTVQKVITNLQGWKKTTSKLGSARQKTSPLASASVVVEGINIAKRHTKPRPKAGKTNAQPRIQQGGILEVPQPILASKVMLICPHCTQPTRVKHGLAGDGRSVRLCANCGETLVREVRK